MTGSLLGPANLFLDQITDFFEYADVRVDLFDLTEAHLRSFAAHDRCPWSYRRWPRNSRWGLPLSIAREIDEAINHDSRQNAEWCIVEHLIRT